MGEESQHLCRAFRDPFALFILLVKPLFNQQPLIESLNHELEHAEGGKICLTFTVELEGGQGGIDAHGDWPMFKQSVGQLLLVALWNLFVVAALSRFARLPVLAGLLLNTTRTAKQQLNKA